MRVFTFLVRRADTLSRLAAILYTRDNIGNFWFAPLRTKLLMKGIYHKRKEFTSKGDIFTCPKTAFNPLKLLLNIADCPQVPDETVLYV